MCQFIDGQRMENADFADFIRNWSFSHIFIGELGGNEVLLIKKLTIDACIRDLGPQHKLPKVRREITVYALYRFAF